MFRVQLHVGPQATTGPALTKCNREGGEVTIEGQSTEPPKNKQITPDCNVEIDHAFIHLPFHTPAPDFGASEATVLIGSVFSTSVRHAEGEGAHQKLVAEFPKGFQRDQTVVVLANDGDASVESGSLSYRQCPKG